MTHHSPIIAGRNDPFSRPMCRYQLSVTVGIHTVTQNCADLDAAMGALERFREREAGNRDAHGGIYDREEMRTVANWCGEPKRKPLPTIADVFAKLIARGEPVSIIGDRGAAHFNTTVEKDQVA